jgi:hypothetical protein
MLQKSNKCAVCKQKLHSNWWSSWGVHEDDEEMKELAQDMHLKNLKHDMVNNVLEATKSELELKLDGECNFNLICNLLEFSICFANYIMISLTNSFC